MGGSSRQTGGDGRFVFKQPWEARAGVAGGWGRDRRFVGQAAVGGEGRSGWQAGSGGSSHRDRSAEGEGGSGWWTRQ